MARHRDGETSSDSDGSARTPPDSVFLRSPREKRTGSSLTRESIIDAAVRLLDSEGADALTMRRLAGALGVHATSLYWYVDRREDLVDLAVDRVLADAAADDAGGGDWEGAITRTARSMYAAFVRHSWVAGFAASRPLLGPNALALSARILAALASTGASERHRAVAATTISNLILGSAAAAAGAAALGVDDPDSPLAREIVARVSAAEEPPPSLATWTSFFDESLTLVMVGVRDLLANGDDAGDTRGQR